MQIWDTGLSLSLAAAILYALTSALLGARLNQPSSEPGAPKWVVLGAGAVALFLHAGALIPLILTPQGWDLNFFNALSAVAWLMVCSLLVAALVYPVESTGIVLLPLAALVVLLGHSVHGQPHLIRTQQWGIELHVLVSLLAYGILSIAAVQAILLAIQDWHLRNRRPGGWIRALPPLAMMESLLFQLIAVGFVFLSVALLSGAIFLTDIFAQHLVHKTVLSIAAWLVFAVLLWGRWRFGWRGRTAIRWTLGGMATLLLAYFGSKFVLELVLRRPY